MQSKSAVFSHAQVTWYKRRCNRTPNSQLNRLIVHKLECYCVSCRLWPASTAPSRKMAGSQQNTTNWRRAHTFTCFTYLFRCSYRKNTGVWSYLAVIIQIHSLSEEVFPLMPAWKLPSSWQPEAEEDGRAGVTQSKHGGGPAHYPLHSLTHQLLLMFDTLNRRYVLCVQRCFKKLLKSIWSKHITSFSKLQQVVLQRSAYCPLLKMATSVLEPRFILIM